MNAYLAELIGTALLVLLGDGVVANVVLHRTKGHGSGWIVIAAGWGFAVYLAVLCVADFSGAHLNPAVTVALAVAQSFAWRDVPGYILAQLLGGVLGATLVFAFYKRHYDATDDPDAKLGTFCTIPAIRAGMQPVLRSCCDVRARLRRTAVERTVVPLPRADRITRGRGQGRSGIDRRPARRADRVRDRTIVGRNDRVCHQSGPRSRTAHCARPLADTWQAGQRLVVRLDTRRGPDRRRPAGRNAAPAWRTVAALSCGQAQRRSSSPIGLPDGATL